MIIYKTREEIELIRESCLLVNNTIAEIGKFIKPGISTMYLNNLAEEFIRDHGATPSFKDYHGFPYACCMSVNDAVVHGFPTSNELKEGDVLSVDVGVFKTGFHGDSAYTFALVETSDEIKKLMRVTKQALYKGIEKAVAGNRVGDISFAIQEHSERKNGYGVVRELVGHGLGKELHEDPQVPNYGEPGKGLVLREGLVLAIEPMINLGRHHTKQLKDGWTVVTVDGRPSAHFEHTVAITQEGPQVLTRLAA